MNTNSAQVPNTLKKPIWDEENEVGLHITASVDPSESLTDHSYSPPEQAVALRLEDAVLNSSPQRMCVIYFWTETIVILKVMWIL